MIQDQLIAGTHGSSAYRLLTDCRQQKLQIPCSPRSLHDFHHSPAIMHLILTGATGLVGAAVLDNMLAQESISRISILSRRPVKMAEGHDKARVIIHKDFQTYDKALLDELRDAQGCVWALGVSQNDVNKEYARLSAPPQYALAKMTTANTSKSHTITPSPPRAHSTLSTRTHPLRSSMSPARALHKHRACLHNYLGVSRVRPRQLCWTFANRTPTSGPSVCDRAVLTGLRIQRSSLSSQASQRGKLL